jgi:hypothetical protein
VSNTSTGPIPAPQGSTDCSPEVQRATATEYLLVSPAKPSNFIWGELVSGGQLGFIIENLPKTTPRTGYPGKWMFQQMTTHFGSSVTAIQGNWVGPMSANLREVNRLTAAGMMLQEAAKATWTGMRAQHYDYTQCAEVSTHRTAGNYSAVHVVFTK